MYVSLVHAWALRLNVCTSGSWNGMYQYVPSTYKYMTFFIDLVRHLSRFWRVHLCTYWWFLSTYLGVPDSFAGLQGPAGLPAGDSCTSTRTDPNHTTEGLFIAACQHPCLPMHTWALALACLGIQIYTSIYRVCLRTYKYVPGLSWCRIMNHMIPY